MFYGLNNFIKRLLPKQLFYRALLIVAAPIIILQITISIVFFDSLWIKTNKGMTRALVNEINTRGNFVKKISDFLQDNQNIKFKLEVVSLRDSKTAEPIVVEINILKLET